MSGCEPMPKSGAQERFCPVAEQRAYAFADGVGAAENGGISSGSTFHRGVHAGKRRRREGYEYMYALYATFADFCPVSLPTAQLPGSAARQPAAW